MGKTRDLFKKIRDTKGTFHTKICTIKDRNVWTQHKQKILRRGDKNVQKNFLNISLVFCHCSKLFNFTRFAITCSDFINSCIYHLQIRNLFLIVTFLLFLFILCSTQNFQKLFFLFSL